MLEKNPPAPVESSDDYSPSDILTAASGASPRQNHPAKPLLNLWPTETRIVSVYCFKPLSVEVIPPSFLYLPSKYVVIKLFLEIVLYTILERSIPLILRSHKVFFSSWLPQEDERVTADKQQLHKRLLNDPRGMTAPWNSQEEWESHGIHPSRLEAETNEAQQLWPIHRQNEICF